MRKTYTYTLPMVRGTVVEFTGSIVIKDDVSVAMSAVKLYTGDIVPFWEWFPFEQNGATVMFQMTKLLVNTHILAHENGVATPDSTEENSNGKP